jgi:hypothetical protein
MTLPVRLRRVRFRDALPSDDFGHPPEGHLHPTHVDGETIIMQQDDPDGIGITTWLFRYRGADNIYEFIGGMPLQDEVNLEEQTSSITFGDLASVGPLFTLPLGGVYFFQSFFATGYRADAAASIQAVRMGPTGYETGNAAWLGRQNAMFSSYVGRHVRWGFLKLGEQIRTTYMTNTGAPVWFSHRSLTAVPVYLFHFTPAQE